MRTRRTQFGPLLCMGLAAALQLSCSSEPPSSAESEPSFNHGPSHLTISGPAEIWETVRKNYAYTATVNGFYVSFSPWGLRFCPTLSLTSCTTAWASTIGDRIAENQSRITPSLVKDCTGGGTKSFQVRATATAFGMGTMTQYKVTKLCGTDPRP